jgi:hypothetical protein
MSENMEVTCLTVILSRNNMSADRVITKVHKMLRMKIKAVVRL